ncbi:hypothetical protein HS088_TW17G00242 [Tripterygium wilfordii]|uniref:Uncharacterized protein n=1 Tax=Tripterygium wilfordii TaxID=458696 RepID=A0A7J7CG00_TRIWF|nr:uncharacterized protein LOC119982988 [Tripterygium wilfordii]XP_038682551.1 uncharacterized protein LOC119982989 [Tripterygium wilfordii]KAF5732706.1 hypothetical protein HS088_TW17G00236 [Tripterygium wilfordii]KAF5732712.1 hypothetical protein HS088_TW17G00242 [Tripterygium wilfordii]
MASIIFSSANLTIANCNRIPCLKFAIAKPSLKFPISSKPIRSLRSQSTSRIQISEEDEEGLVVEDLRVPDHWLLPSKALEESEWLRVTLHKWLDDEYCPEETNVEISKVAAQSYYESLLDKQTDLGEILLKIARDLESISYKESFHGAFSSANAAVNLIAQRIEQE